MQKEIWKDIPGYEGLYQVSNFGNVFSCRYNDEKNLKLGFVGKNGKEYHSVTLCVNTYKKRFSVHVLVAMAFLNHVPCGHTIIVEHKDGNRLNNNLENLELISNRENIARGYKNKGTSKYTGVSWCKINKKWIAKIYINGKRKHLGYYINELDAHLAYQNALNELK